MGFISRKIFPACGNMCVCCPALRSRSRQPVKRYKKLLADIFPKSPDGSPSDRKIVKLCEYAAKNPLRIPKIAKHLEDRCYKELQSQHIRFINIVVEVYEKLLYMCKEQMAYFAVSLLNVTSELLENSKQDSMRILGCQTLTKFIYSQADGTYAHSIENYVIKVCKLACKNGEEHQKHCLRASSLQCLSAMVWYMAEFSYIFAAFDEMVHAILDNYEPKTPREGVAEGGDPHHNWLNEVVRCEGRGSVIGETNPSCLIIRPFSEKKDPKLLTREEIETPRIWAHICIQRMVDLAKESTTMRLILDPVFVYFDSGRHWVPRQGLATMVLSDMCYFMETLGSQQLILAALIRHLDHKNVARDLQLKSYIIQVAAVLTKQVRMGGLLKDGGFVSDLCWHLRKSLQATVESVGEEEANLNLSLQNSIELCLHEIAKGIGDAVPLFDVMAITLENLPSSGVIARATIGSLMILAHIISLLGDSSRSQQAFPEALLIQLLKAMLHPDVEARIGAHGIFSVLLIPSSNRFRPELASLEAGYLIETRRRRSNTASTFASITALLEKLRKEKDGAKVENPRDDVFDIKERDIPEEDWKQGCAHKKDSPNLYKISSIIDKTTGSTGMTEAELFITKLSEDDLEQLLSGFWIQANLPDNLPSNFEAIAHSFVLTCVSSRLTNPNANLVVRFFQLPLSLMNMSMDSTNETLSPACRRSILVLSMAMLMFTAKIYHMNDLLETLLPLDVDPYLGISDDFQLYIKSQADVNVYGSATDILLANSVLSELRSKIYEETAKVVEVLVQNLSIIAELEADDLARQLAEPFTPDDTFIFSQGSILDLDMIQMVSHSKESLSFDQDIPNGSLVEDDAISEESVADVLRIIAKTPSSPSGSHIISIGQLMESALAVAGRVAATSVSTSPLSYDTMASQCETLGTGSRKKLSNWLAHENPYGQVADTVSPAFPDGHSGRKVGVDAGDVNGSIKPKESSLAIRLPPASPFDNFLKAAGCQKEEKTIFSH